MTLYEINKAYLSFLEQIESGDIPEEAIDDTLEAIEGDFTEKADSIASYIKQLTAEADGIAAEVAALSGRMKAKKQAAANLRQYLYRCFKEAGRDKLETSRNVIAVRKNPPKVQIDDLQAFTDWAERFAPQFVKLPPPEPKKTEILTALKEGQEIPHCLIWQEEGVRIK